VSLQKKDKSELLRDCLEQLSQEHREVIDLVYYHEKSVEEVAEIVGIPEATVKTRMFYARKKLSELLKAAGLDRGWP
jgi:RNA polymerase sigma-70 factor (ECF subfamily)